MVFSTVTGAEACMIANTNSTINITASYSSSGGGASHFGTQGFSQIIVNSTIAITISGTPAYTIGFCNVTNGGGGFTIESSGNVTFVGSATGPKFNISAGAIINTNGAGASFFPGSSAGTGQTSNYF